MKIDMHAILQEWVLTTEPQTKPEITVRRWNGVEHLAAIHMLYVSEPNAEASYANRSCH
jgi:hypothetical protein